MSLAAARDDWAECSRLRPLAPVLTIDDNGLVLGTTVLIPMRRDACVMPTLAIEGAEGRVLALLAIACGETIGPRVLDNIRRASKYWGQGETHLAAIELALSGFPPLDDPNETSFRLFLADKLLVDGLSPRELVKACGIDGAPLDAIKGGYNPNQPRVPAGNPDGGQWTSNTDEPPPAASIEPSDYKLVKEPPRDAKVVIAADGIPISAGNPPTLLIAPPHADFRQVYAAGQAIAAMAPLGQILHIRAALRQGGTFDFQRNPIRQEAYPSYANASNYAVGVYMAGAGYSLWETLHAAEAYAFFNSSNYNSQKQTDWTTAGWNDATAGRWK
jgi:hypothetical protein